MHVWLYASTRHDNIGRTRKTKQRRTLGGITGLSDVLLLPPLYATGEDSKAKDKLLLTVMRLHACNGTRPIGIVVDDLSHSWSQLVRTLSAAFPATVHLVSGQEWPVQTAKWLEEEHVVVNETLQEAKGIRLAQDPLHIYKRLVESLNFRSRESSFAGRTLQALLASWNPAGRMHSRKEVALGQKMPRVPSWIHFDQWEATRPPSLSDVLSSYFFCSSFPPSAFNILASAVAVDWPHPSGQWKLPLCAKVVLLRDVGRAASRSEADIDATIHAMYPVDLTVDEILSELRLLQEALQQRLFRGSLGGASGLWFQQQMQYLKHFRKRPVFKRDGSDGPAKVKPGSQDEAAGDGNFIHVLQLQTKPLIVQGLLNAWSLKKWSIENHLPMSLGSVGTERAWRNLQRGSRNLARSAGDDQSRDILLAARWFNEVHARLAARHDPSRKAYEDRPGLKHVMLCSEMLADSILNKRPRPVHADGRGPHGTCDVYNQYVKGCL